MAPDVSLHAHILYAYRYGTWHEWRTLGAHINVFLFFYGGSEFNSYGPDCDIIFILIIAMCRPKKKEKKSLMKQIMVYYLNGESFNKKLMIITFENNECNK